MNEIMSPEEGLQLEAKKLGDMPLIEVVDEESKKIATDQVRFLKVGKSAIQEYWEDLKSAANKVHKDLCKKEKKMLDPVDFGIRIREQKLGQYQFKIEQKAREEQQRLIAEQKKQADAAKAAALKLAAETGDIQRAEAILNIPIIVAPVPMPELQKEKGERINRPWEVEIFDKIALLKAIADGMASLDFVEFKIKDMDKAATIIKLGNPWPGVRAKEILKFSVR